MIERELGRGGVGVVFLARDERLHGMPVVIKFLLEDAGRNRWLIGKFSQEAEALTRINHPGVVRVIDRDLSDDGRPFFVMEFIKGRPLRDVMGQVPLDLAYIAHLARQTGSALHAAHQQGVFHRDLKPENIMLEQLSGGDEQVKLIDFGIAKVVNPQAGNETEVAVVAGSRQYIAPEQLLSQTASPATDVYALAIIVYEMVTGRLPFNPEGPTHFLVMQELMRLQKGESFVTPRTFRPTCRKLRRYCFSTRSHSTRDAVPRTRASSPRIWPRPWWKNQRLRRPRDHSRSGAGSRFRSRRWRAAGDADRRPDRTIENPIQARRRPQTSPPGLPRRFRREARPTLSKNAKRPARSPRAANSRSSPG